MDVFKEGRLYLQGVKFGKKTWRKIWVIILKPRTLEIGRLEVYSLPDDVTEDELPPQQDNTKRRVVLLSDCLGITLAPEELCPPGCTAFYLDTTLRTYTLASEVCQDWLLALGQLTFQDPGEEISEQEDSLLMKDCDIYAGFGDQPEEYHVTVLDTAASERSLLFGDFTFLLHSEAAFLLDRDTADIIYRWPYIFLRRFGILKGGFCIEAGPQCDSGEGLFSFLSRQGSEVCHAIGRHCLIEREAVDPSAQASSHSHKTPRVEAGPDPAGHLYAEVNHRPAPVDGRASPQTQRPSRPPPHGGEEAEAGRGAQPVSPRPVRRGGGGGPDGVYSLAGDSAAEGSASHYQAVPFAVGTAAAAATAGPPRWAGLFSKGARKTKATGGPGDRSPSGPQNGAPPSFQQKLSKLVSIDLAKLQFPRRFGKDKS